MAVFINDTFARRKRRAGDGARTGRQGLILFLFLFLSMTLLVMSKLNHPWVTVLRGAVASVALPVAEHMAAPVHALRNTRRLATTRIADAEEYEAMQTEMARLKQWEWRSRELEKENRVLREHLRLAVDLPSGFVTGRLITDGRGPFFKSAMINVGSAHKVALGYAVMDVDGLVGHVVDVGARASRVLFLTDLNSRVPVFVGESRVRAIAVGENTDTLALLFAPQGSPLRPGDIVSTSGAGGVFPAGLRLGEVVLVSGTPRVTLFATPGTAEYASVLIYNAPRIEPNELADTRVLRRPRLSNNSLAGDPAGGVTTASKQVETSASE